jgi:hypothetical protein
MMLSAAAERAQPAAGHRRQNDRLADRMGDTGLASTAAAIGMSVRTLKSFLAGNPVYARTREKIAAYLDA